MTFCITFAAELITKRKQTSRKDSMMTEKIKFTKMHGAGNDYIYVNTMLCEVPNPSEAAILWSDRHKGIGSDGLVLIGRSSIPEADFRHRGW